LNSTRNLAITNRSHVSGTQKVTAASIKVIFGYNSYNKVVVQPHREWVVNIVNCCRASLKELSCSIQDRTKWNSIILKKRQTAVVVEPKVYDDDDDGDNDVIMIYYCTIFVKC